MSRLWPYRRRLVSVLGCVVVAAALVSCGGSDTSEGTAKGTATPTRAAAASTPPEDGCARVKSAIGWTEFMLAPAGREDHQNFRSGVRGRLAYVEGTVVLFGEYLPQDAVAPAARLRRWAHRIVDLDTSRAQRVAGLRHYRQAVRDVETACGDTATG